MRKLPIAVLAVLSILALLSPAGANRALHAPALSATVPPINLDHLFEGEINRQGRPVGFHSRPGGRDPAGARLVRVVDRPNRQGVYTAKVEIRTSGGRWLGKQSTFYPDRMSRQDVLAAILNAYRRRTTGSSEQFRGPSGQGFTIEGWYQNGRINTAYPIFQ
ncbi:MAG TPA: EndoU domain-containing protein [Thermoanaerobaculia bacterium]|nr:EndoU domain-containing protein [Thermoanaerobaculia bacterium]